MNSEATAFLQCKWWPQSKGEVHAQDEAEFLENGEQAASNRYPSDHRGNCPARLPNLFGARWRPRKCTRGLDACRTRAARKIQQASAQSLREIDRRLSLSDLEPAVF